MFGFDLFPIAAASLDMTADFTPLFSGLLGLLGLSAMGIALSALSLWLRNSRRAPAHATVTERAPQEQAKAA